MSGNVPEKLTEPYNPKETEGRIYAQWEESGYFNPDNLPPRQGSGQANKDGESYAIVLPPPNVTGVLHLGHAYEDSLQDAIIRFQRMRGKRALWVPGADSAAVATQARVEKNIKKEEGKTRHDIGREELVRRVLEFAKESESTILNQVRRMGSSLDWSRYAYTLDEKRNAAVATAFKRMYDAGLIYRGNRIVNWDPKGQTTISDDEVVHEEHTGKLYTFKYSKDFPIAISTTRPETKVGDTAVAVHPDDERYKKYVGTEYDVVFCDVPIHIKVVADKSVEKDFGTGALGVTPAHAQIDWEIADRHNLPRAQVINEYAKMDVGGRLNGMKVSDAREAIVEWLKKEGLLDKEEEITQNVSTSERTGAIIEPLPKLQWWVDVNKPFTIPHSEIPSIESGSETTLKHMMRAMVESGAVSMPQNGFRSAYFHWIDNLHDWCISRQIWFGHRIPVYYCRNTPESNSKQQDTNPKQIPNSKFQIPNNPCGEPFVSTEPIESCPNCGDKVEQDPDVLDTWFSSALWTFSTLGWPAFAETATAGKPGPENDLANYHPTSFMSPAYEILFLWVSRMILMSGFHLGQPPFKTVILHGLVKDKQGRKFSKSLGNGVDPLEMIDKYGADALRMGLLAGTAIGNDINFDENKVKGYKHFANKIWNIARFVLENADGVDFAVPYSKNDQVIWNRFNVIVKEITKDMENYQLHLASEAAYHYAWHEFADKILEHSKTIFDGESPDELGDEFIASRKKLLYSIFVDTLKLLHPFMPFVTEEIWSMLPEHAKDRDMLMVSAWPKHKK